MSKLVILSCLILAIISAVMACNPPGFLCTTDDDCCEPLGCNAWAGRCTNKMPYQQTGCKTAGLVCSTDSDCCEPLGCNAWAGRCTTKMTGPGGFGGPGYGRPTGAARE